MPAGNASRVPATPVCIPDRIYNLAHGEYRVLCRLTADMDDDILYNGAP